MKRLLVILTFAAAVALLAVVALAPSGRSSSTDARRPISPMGLPPATRAGEMTLYGHIKTLKRVGGRLEMGFDPAWVTQGLTARRASLADTGSSVVPDKYYYVDNGGPHRKLWEPLRTGVWIRVRIDTIREVNQQYQA